MILLGSLAHFEPDWLSNGVLEADLALREPGELDGGGRHGLLVRKIDGGLPVLQSEVAVDLEVLADALDDLKVDIVERRAPGGEAGCGAGAALASGRYGLGCRTGDEVAGGLLIPQAHLEPLIAAQMVGKPRLATLVLTADPVAEELALVGVTLLLNSFVVHEVAV